MASELPVDWSLYPYTPSKAAPIFFAVLLSLVAILQCYLSFFRYRWRKFGATMVWSAAVWIAGFVCRSISAREVQNVNMFIAQYCLVYMGPPLFAATEYFILGRLFAYLPYHTPMQPNRVISTFIILGAIVESLTASGGADSANKNASPQFRAAGRACLYAALILQALIEVFFFSLVARLDYRCRRGKAYPQQLRTLFIVLYVTSTMVLVRCVVRAVESFSAAGCTRFLGYCGYVALHEWIFWVFEVSNITLFVLLLTVFHPGGYLPRSTKVYLDPLDGKTERVGPGFSKAVKRPFWATVADPFNLRKAPMHKFWEEENPILKSGGDDGTLLQAV